MVVRRLDMINWAVLDRYRCPEEFGEYRLMGNLPAKAGYFKFGEDATCFGHCSSIPLSGIATNGLHDSSSGIRTDESALALPFDPSEVVSNLLLERYPVDDGGSLGSIRDRTAISRVYYFIRPLLSVGTRKYLQRLALRDWKTRHFPKWPVDLTVENILKRCLILSMKTRGVTSLPFIWFWPEGHSSCCMITHDVETEKGRQFTSALMDIDAAFGFKTSFQVVPEERYQVTEEYLESIRKRGCEVNVQDLNHDGHLYSDRAKFLQRADQINRYVKHYREQGFRAGALYRNVEWYDALEVAYDMSVPNCAHLDPQRGGCCTVFPYFIGNVLELPVTTVQDYS